ADCFHYAGHRRRPSNACRSLTGDGWWISGTRPCPPPPGSLSCSAAWRRPSRGRAARIADPYRRLIHISAARDDPRRLVLVIDDVSRLSAQKRAWLRELTRNGVQIIVVVERSLPSDALAMIRASLEAAPLLSAARVSLRSRWNSPSSAGFQCCTASRWLADAVAALLLGRWFDRIGLRVLVLSSMLSACFAPLAFGR